MSLETEIASLTLAVQALTKALASQPASTPPPTYVEADLGQAQPEPVKVAKPAKAKPVKVEAPTPEPEPTPEPAKKYTVQDIRTLAQAALDDGKLAGVVAINKEFGLRKISEATEDKFAEIIARLTTLVHG
jgi:hypothetical protein